MSIKIIHEQLLKFISDSVPSVVAVKGDWGVGKTYAWEKYLYEAKEQDMIACKRYSYVSLFGISTMESLKYSIFENSINHESIGSEPSLESFRTNAVGVLERLGRSSLSKFKDMPYIKSASPAVEAFSFMSINNTLVCIDDLERRGKGLELKDVLGLVSLLKEKKKCKVLLLLNDGADTITEYETYKEKVIDMELEFSPTPEESAAIAFDGTKSYHEELKKYTISLGIRNIRVLFKIKNYVGMVYQFFEKVESKIKSQLLMSTVLFSWSHYCSNYDEDIPKMDFIEKTVNYSYMGSGKLSHQQKNWQNTLLSYGFVDFDKLDFQISLLVRKGYFDREVFEGIIKSSNEMEVNNKKVIAHRNAWNDFHNNFSLSSDEIMNNLNNSFLSAINFMTPHDLNSIVTVFRNLNDDRRIPLIDKYVEVRLKDVELYDADYFISSHSDLHEEIKAKFDEAFSTVLPNENVCDVIYKIIERNSWSKRDELILSNASEIDYYNFFKSVSSDDFTQVVSTCLKFRNANISSENESKIINSVEGALRKIASESELNKLRLRKFGI